jgi:hypothetical protein
LQQPELPADYLTANPNYTSGPSNPTVNPHPAALFQSCSMTIIIQLPHAVPHENPDLAHHDNTFLY